MKIQRSEKRTLLDRKISIDRERKSRRKTVVRLIFSAHRLLFIYYNIILYYRHFRRRW